MSKSIRLVIVTGTIAVIAFIDILVGISLGAKQSIPETTDSILGTR